MVLVWKMEGSLKSSNLVSECVKILMGIKRELCVYFLRGHGNNQECRFVKICYFISVLLKKALFISGVV